MDFELNGQEKNVLLKIARDTLEMWIRERKRAVLPKAEGNLTTITGAFVTLHRKGTLRGCIGNMIGQWPLVKTIQEMAIAASTEDTRFPPVRPEELKEIDIEISVLSPLKKINDINEIEVGKHGLLLGRGWARGVLLPQVATEYAWDRVTFLENTCLKAGLDPDDWKKSDISIEIFSAQVFGER